MSPYASWHVGMKVVCMASADKIGRARASVIGAELVTAGGVYTIREIRDDAPWRHGESRIVLLLKEVDNRHLIGARFNRPNSYCYVEPGFPITSFRPVQTRKTDISIFTAMLAPKQVERA